MPYSHSANDIAAKLRTIADKFATLGDVPIPETWVSIDLQVTTAGEPNADARKATVDLLAAPFGDTPKYAEPDEGKTETLYRTERNDDDVCVYAGQMPYPGGEDQPADEPKE